MIMMGTIINMVFKKQKKTINHLVEHGVVNIKLISKSSKFDEVFRNLDDRTKGMLLMALQYLDEGDMEKVLYKLTEITREKKIKLRLEDMPQMTKEFFTQKNMDRTLKGINDRGQEGA